MLNSILGSELTLVSFLICTAVSLLLGVGTALVSMYRSRTTQSFAVTLAILPAVVQLVIMLVNGNLGAGVAVAGCTMCPDPFDYSGPVPNGSVTRVRTTSLMGFPVTNSAIRPSST